MSLSLLIIHSVPTLLSAPTPSFDILYPAQLFFDCLTLKMKALKSSETSETSCLKNTTSEKLEVSVYNVINFRRNVLEKPCVKHNRLKPNTKGVIMFNKLYVSVIG